MKQAFLKNKNFEIQERPLPLVGDRQVLVKTTACGVCEGDLFLFSHSGGNRESLPLGHEASGIVEETGKEVSRFKKGDRVTCLGGGYAEYFAADPEDLVLVPPQVSLPGALGEPLACCVHGAERFRIRMGDRVAVLGCGFMGMICLQLARLRGASEITVFDLTPWRLQDALKLGADRAIDASGIDPAHLPAEVQDLDVVIEAAGVEETISLGSALLRHHGTLNLIGYHQTGGGFRRINMKEWNFKALDVVNAHVRNNREKREAMEIAMKLLAAGKITTETMVRDYRFSDINKAFHDLSERPAGLYKANIVFDGS